jgi:hypothetical protein
VVGGQCHAPAGRFTLGKTWYPLYRRLGRPQDRSGHVRKISPPLGFDPQTIQPVASLLKFIEMKTLCRIVSKHCLTHIEVSVFLPQGTALPTLRSLCKIIWAEPTDVLINFVCLLSSPLSSWSCPLFGEDYPWQNASWGWLKYVLYMWYSSLSIGTHNFETFLHPSYVQNKKLIFSTQSWWDCHGWDALPLSITHYSCNEKDITFTMANMFTFELYQQCPVESIIVSSVLINKFI